jgi:hypothetical protein
LARAFASGFSGVFCFLYENDSYALCAVTLVVNVPDHGFNSISCIGAPAIGIDGQGNPSGALAASICDIDVCGRIGGVVRSSGGRR